MLLGVHGFKVKAVGTVDKALSGATSNHYEVVNSDLKLRHLADGLPMLFARTRLAGKAVYDTVQENLFAMDVSYLMLNLK